MTKDEAKKQLDALCSVAKEVGLVINAGKRKLLSKNIDPKPEIKHDETVLEMEDHFQFLGACINDAMKDFKHWRAKIWTAFWKLKKNQALQCWYQTENQSSSMHQFSVFFSMLQKHM